jgi:alpha-L-fucosidase
MDHRDIRFNQTEKHLYVTAMGWPEEGKLLIKSLAKGNPNFKKPISSVLLLGYGRLKARQTKEGLEVQLPQPCNKIAPVLKIKKRREFFLFVNQKKQVDQSNHVKQALYA